MAAAEFHVRGKNDPWGFNPVAGEPFSTFCPLALIRISTTKPPNMYLYNKPSRPGLIRKHAALSRKDAPPCYTLQIHHYSRDQRKHALL